MIEMMADQVPELPRKVARRQAIAALSTMAGALVLSRVAGTGEFSEEILGAGRAAALGRATNAPAKKPRAKPN
jgi:TetR/AcrR family transcriptional regulator, transcriptional repressor for nem operon